jgi:NTP pyrophosphatase (non-canonical NTP hydrolase)
MTTGRMQKKRNFIFIHATYYRTFARITRKLKAEDFLNADSFKTRDEVMRIFAAECYELAEEFAKQNKQNLSLQYAKLSAKMLGLSLRPKKLSDLDEIKRVLAELKAQEKTE